jgi:hypothetical protein
MDLPMSDEQAAAEQAVSATAAAEWLLSVFRVAAHRRPEILRELLATVFDLSAVEHQTAVVCGQLRAIWKQLVETRELSHAVNDGLKQIEERIDKLSFAVEEAERAS